MKSPITNQRHLNDFGFACINGYKGTIYEYMQGQYQAYCKVCNNCGITPMSYDAWRCIDSSKLDEAHLSSLRA